MEKRLKQVMAETREEVETAHQESQERVAEMNKTLEESTTERRKLEGKVRSLQTQVVSLESQHTQALLEVEETVRKVSAPR